MALLYDHAGLAAATIDPDPETLTKARADFGGMLLTPEIIAANPPPWS
jgi:hypothetical protein